MTDTPARLVRRGALPDMVRWYSPTLLAQIAVRTAISSTFGQYADQRLLQAVTDSASEAGLRVRYDFSDQQTPDPAHRLPTDSHGGIWVDYAADVGDGFLATYATAYHLAQPSLDVPNAGKLPAGDILIMGGDQAYPAATREGYKDRFQLPFRWAFPATTAQRRMFAIPGNHDWYDGSGRLRQLVLRGARGRRQGRLAHRRLAVPAAPQLLVDPVALRLVDLGRRHPVLAISRRRADPLFRIDGGKHAAGP